MKCSHCWTHINARSKSATKRRSLRFSLGSFQHAVRTNALFLFVSFSSKQGEEFDAKMKWAGLIVFTQSATNPKWLPLSNDKNELRIFKAFSFASPYHSYTVLIVLKHPSTDCMTLVWKTVSRPSRCLLAFHLFWMKQRDIVKEKGARVIDKWSEHLDASGISSGQATSTIASPAWVSMLPPSSIKQVYWTATSKFGFGWGISGGLLEHCLLSFI